MRSVNVPLGDRSYRIEVGTNLLGELGARCAALDLGRRCAVITDEHVGPLYARPVLEALSQAGFDTFQITVPAGETAKSLNTVATCYDALARHRLERRSFIVALGGGVVGDLAGFVAATYLRGVAFVQVPTSLLAQVDSSVGGKVGVNLVAGKNLVGAFHQPRLVLADLDTLSSLPEREYRSGLGEVVKYGIICDAELFARLERGLEQVLAKDHTTLAEIVARCCEIKAEVVGEDERDGGRRAILNFGHTIGHAIEAISGYGQYLHGEAIALGHVAAARISASVCGLAAEDVARIEHLLTAAALPTRIRLDANQLERLFAAMRLDKKVISGEVRFVLARAIGQAKVGCPVKWDQVASILEPWVCVETQKV